MQLKYVLLLCSFFVGPSTTLWAPPDASTSAALGAASGVGVATSDPATSHVSVTRPQSTQRTEDSEAGTGLTRQTSGSTALPPAWPGATSPSSFPLRTSTLVASNTAKASHPAPVGQKQQTDLSNHVVAALTYQIKPPANTSANGRRSLRSGNTSALRTRASQSTASPSQIPVPPSTPPPSIPPPPPEGHTGIYRQPQPPPPPPLTPFFF